MLGMLDDVCLLCGGITFKGFSTATSPMMYMGVAFQVRSQQIVKGYVCDTKIEDAVSGRCQKRSTARNVYVLAVTEVTPSSLTRRFPEMAALRVIEIIYSTP